MHRIDTLTAVKDKFGPGKNGFTDGNIRTGLATWLNSAMWDAIQEEICGVIEKAGIELNKENTISYIKPYYYWWAVRLTKRHC